MVHWHEGAHNARRLPPGMIPLSSLYCRRCVVVDDDDEDDEDDEDDDESDGDEECPLGDEFSEITWGVRSLRRVMPGLQFEAVILPPSLIRLVFGPNDVSTPPDDEKFEVGGRDDALFVDREEDVD